MTDSQASVMTARLLHELAKAHSRAAWNDFNRYAILPLGDVTALAQACRDSAAREVEAEFNLANAIASHLAEKRKVA